MSNTTSALNITVLDYIDAKQLKEDLAFSINDLTSAMMGQSSLFAHYGQLAADASYQVDKLEMALKTTESAVYKAIRDDYAKKGEKVTEGQLTNLVASHDHVKALKLALNRAIRVENVCKSAVEAFRQRRDMLIQCGSTMREEMKGEVYIRGRQNAEESVQNLEKSLLSNMNR